MSNNRSEVELYVSIILPSLNVASYIKECIESVLNQTLQQIEILCVDAGSTDGTFEILEEYASKDIRIRIIKSSQKSYGYQINLGIAEAKGHYIGIVETDDFIDASMYQKLYSYAENDYPDFVKGGFYDYAEIGNRKFICKASRKGLSEVFGKLIHLEKEQEKIFFDLNHIWSGIYRRDFLLEKGIKLNETPGASYQDTSFSLLVGLLADTGIYIEESYYFYRRNNENSSVKSSSKWRCIIDEFEYVIQEMQKKERYSADIQRLIWTYKPTVYFWNFLRLPKKEREQFQAEIRCELEEYMKKSNLCNSLNDDQKKLIEVMSNQKASESYFLQREALREKYEKLITLIKQGGKCILVSAGMYGERMLLLQEITEIKYIDAVADNNIERQGSLWNQYVLISISEAVNKYKEHWFVIANKKYSQRIREQLSDAGIQDDKILVFDAALSLTELIELAEGRNI